MSSKTKIVVLRMKEIIYTAIFIGLGILLVLLLFFMFRPKHDAAPTSADAVLYTPGVYSSSLILGSQEINVEVAVEADRICSISMVPLSDAVTTMYPLIAPSLESLTAQICESQSLDHLTYPQESQYTSRALIQAIGTALEKARIK
ncbi:MAG: hypothetical protein Q4C73_02725 [Eubacteriales bacterium]|nr:hypothetical protein [Eubacteriales bacterium]